MIYVDHIEVCPEKAYVTEWETNRELRARVSPNDATCQDVKWYSEDSEIAEINEQTGYLTGKKVGNTRIYAQATDGSEMKAYVDVEVTEATYVDLDEYTAVMYIGEKRTMLAEVTPLKAAVKGVVWEMSAPGIVSVSQDDNMITIEALDAGNVVLVATALDGSGERACCQFDIKATVDVDSVEITGYQGTMGVGEKKRFRAKVVPSNATNSSLKWTSSKKRVAEVDENTGWVVAKDPGSVTITATASNGESDSYTINVVEESRKVHVKKAFEDDEEFFTITFPTGNVWKSIGCDMSSDEYRSKYSLTNPDHYEMLHSHEKRMVHNRNHDYSVQELAYAYLFDPLGVVYFVKYYDMALAELLFLKDKLYKEIFGVWPRLIKVFPDGCVGYYKYNTGISSFDRKNYYTDAEILFGEHPIFDWVSGVAYLIDVLPKIACSIFGASIEDFGEYMDIANACKMAFFAVATSEIVSSGRSKVQSLFIDEAIDRYAKTNEPISQKMKKHMGWNSCILDIMITLLEGTSVFYPPIEIVETMYSVSAKNYQTYYLDDDSEITLEELIDRCESITN